MPTDFATDARVASTTEPTQPTPAPDATGILDVNPLPAGLAAADLERIPLPTYAADHREASKRGRPIDLSDALQHLADAGLRIDGRFSREAREAEARRELDAFIAAGEVQGIPTMPESAIRAKREQIKARQVQDARDTITDFQRWTATVGRLLHEARADAVRVRSHLEAMPGQALLAHQTDLLEEHLTELLFERKSLSELVEQYARTPDATNRALVRLIEAGRRPVRTDPTDGAAAVKLARLIRERKAARIGPELRQAFERFELFAKGSLRGTKAALLADGRVR